MDRRTAIKSLGGVAAMGVASSSLGALVSKQTIQGTSLSDDALPTPARKGGLQFLTSQEAETVGAVFNRLIPADELGMGAREAGCVVFLDGQLAGDYGKATAIYRRGPIVPGTPQQGPQLKQTPAERYRNGLSAIDAYCQKTLGKNFSALESTRQDELLTQMEEGKLPLQDIDAEAFFALMLQNVREGYFADPMYGGNKDMVGWKLVGFPGARYDYRDQIAKKGQKLELAPVSMLGRDA